MWVALQWKKTCVGREVSTSTALQQHWSNEKDASTRDAADFLYNEAFLNFSRFLETSKSYQILQNENSILQEHPRTLNTKKCIFRWFKSSNIQKMHFLKEVINWLRLPCRIAFVCTGSTKVHHQVWCLPWNLSLNATKREDIAFCLVVWSTFQKQHLVPHFKHIPQYHVLGHSRSFWKNQPFPTAACACTCSEFWHLVSCCFDHMQLSEYPFVPTVTLKFD